MFERQSLFLQFRWYRVIYVLEHSCVLGFFFVSSAFRNLLWMHILVKKVLTKHETELFSGFVYARKEYLLL